MRKPISQDYLEEKYDLASGKLQLFTVLFGPTSAANAIGTVQNST